MGGVSQEFMQRDDIPGNLNALTGECEQEVQVGDRGSSLQGHHPQVAHPYPYNSDDFTTF